MKIIRFNNFNCLALFFLILIFACTKSDPVNDQQYKGWVVGQAENGFGTILSTSNDGLTWTRQGSQSQAAGVDLYDIHGLDQNNAWAAGGIYKGYGLILHTTDGGTTWLRQGTAVQIPNVRLFSIHAIDALTIWVAGENGVLLFTKDGGSTWTPVTVSDLPPTTFYAITSFGTKSIWAVGTAIDTSMTTDTLGLILYSSDAGTTWSRQGSGDSFPLAFFDVSAGNDSIVFIAGSNSVYKTIDGGKAWQKVLNLTNRNINGICAVDVENIWAVGDHDGIFHSTTGGVSWDSIRPSLTGFRLMGVTVADVNRVWIVGTPSSGIGKGNIIYSRNAGNTWFIENAPVDVGFRRVSFASARR
jgi:photosystem II stability/assembly factor-like uncharacterized protein